MKRFVLSLVLSTAPLSFAATADAAGYAGCPSLKTIKREVVERVNAARSSPRWCGFRRFGRARALRWNGNLFKAAAEHAEHMSRNRHFSHAGRNGTNPGDRINNAGENIAWGQRTAAQVMERWLGSSEHCANIMNPKFTEIAVACSVSGQPKGRARPYWDMALGARW